MTIILGENNIIAVDKLKSTENKNDVSYDVPSKVIHHHQEYIAPVGKSNTKRATFQRAMKLTILIGQCFGLNPVLGVCELDSEKLRFTVYSGRCLYTFIAFLGQLWLVSFCVMKLSFDTDSYLSSNTSLVFYGTNCLTTLLFLRIAMKWPILCQHISKIEAADPNEDKNLVRRCNISCITVLTLALLEHILAVISGVALAIDCQPDKGLYEAYILQSFPWVWRFVNYNIVSGVCSQFFNTISTFNWNFSDAFVICISLYLTSRLEQVNDKIVAVRGQHVAASFWRAIREDYCKITNLVRKVDDVINGVILISFANNLFFICLQLLHILEEGIKVRKLCHDTFEDRPMKGFEQSVYHIYSFGFLMARSLAVSLIASRVHTASKLPAESLYDVPSSSYCIEVQRLIDQIHGDTVALSGLKFFNVKRGLVLTVAGTIVTYELVLMQFTGVTPTSTPPTTDTTP